MSLPDYVERRADILAEMFLRDLNPKFLAQASFQGAVWDYMVAFQTTGGKLIHVAVQVRATEQPFSAKFTFAALPQQVNQFLKSNLPVLILIVDVKTKSYAWNWASNAKIVKDPHLKGHALIQVPVITDEHGARGKLLADIKLM